MRSGVYLCGGISECSVNNEAFRIVYVGGGEQGAGGRELRIPSEVLRCKEWAGKVGLKKRERHKGLVKKSVGCEVVQIMRGNGCLSLVNGALGLSIRVRQRKKAREIKRKRKKKGT